MGFLDRYTKGAGSKSQNSTDLTSSQVEKMRRKAALKADKTKKSKGPKRIVMHKNKVD